MNIYNTSSTEAVFVGDIYRVEKGERLTGITIAPSATVAIADVYAAQSLELKHLLAVGAVSITDGTDESDKLGLVSTQQNSIPVLTHRGKNVLLTAGATTAVVFATAVASAVYGVSVSVNYSTTVFITSKATTGFTINVGTGANGTTDAADWAIFV